MLGPQESGNPPHLERRRALPVQRLWRPSRGPEIVRTPLPQTQRSLVEPGRRQDSGHHLRQHLSLSSSAGHARRAHLDGGHPARLPPKSCSSSRSSSSSAVYVGATHASPQTLFISIRSRPAHSAMMALKKLECPLARPGGELAQPPRLSLARLIADGARRATKDNHTFARGFAFLSPTAPPGVSR